MMWSPLSTWSPTHFPTVSCVLYYTHLLTIVWVTWIVVCLLLWPRRERQASERRMSKRKTWNKRQSTTNKWESWLDYTQFFLSWVICVSNFLLFSSLFSLVHVASSSSSTFFFVFSFFHLHWTSSTWPFLEDRKKKKKSNLNSFSLLSSLLVVKRETITFSFYKKLLPDTCQYHLVVLN